MRKRQEDIHAKGFKMIEDDDSLSFDSPAADFSKMRVGVKSLDDAIVNLGVYRTVNRNYGDKTFILQCINNHDYERLREISNYFYEASGIYQRMCKYLAFLYRYDWYVTPYTLKDGFSENKLLNDYAKVLEYLDNSQVKKLFGNIALEVIKSGSYYGYVMDFDNYFTIQQLPSKYCRSRYFRGPDPVIELNLQFFDAQFPNPQYRIKVLKAFPKEIQKAYVDFKEGKLAGDYPGDPSFWCMLDPDCTVKFCLNNSDFPPLAGAIPSIIDLDQAQDLDRKKTMQQLLKIIIQKLPLDRNSELVFDVDEAADIHNTTCKMISKRAIGLDVLTTFADVEVADLADKNSATTKDDLEKVERTVFNNLGVSQNLFNTDGNLALEKSIANDEAFMKDLIYQFRALLNKVVSKFNRKNNYSFKAEILDTTIYNYKELAKVYKEQTQMGYSKMLPQIALGHSQAGIIASIQFENNVLKLSDIMIPPITSATMSGKVLENNKSSGATGRPEKEDSEKSEKTILNRESMS